MTNTEIKNWLLAVEIALLILLSVSPLITLPIKVVLITAMIVYNFAVMLINYRRIDSSFILLIVLLLFSSVLDVRNTVSGQSYSMTNLMYPVYFVCGYFVVANCNASRFMKAYEQVMLAFAILSLVGMSIYYIAPNAIYSFPTYVQNGATHHTIFIFNYLFADGWMIVRNSGIAWEPGLFQLLLNIALYACIGSFSGKKRMIRVIIYTVAIVLTRSTIGYVILFINVIFLIKQKKPYAFLLIVVIVALWVTIRAEWTYQLEHKLFGTSAFAARYDPMINALRVSWNKPFGLGASGYDNLLKTENIGSFDSYTQILMRYGYFVLAFFIGKFVKMFRNREKGLAIIIALGLVSEPVWGTMLIAAFIFLKNDVNVYRAEKKVKRLRFIPQKGNGYEYG